MRIIVNGCTGYMGRIVCQLAQEGARGTELAAGVSPSSIGLEDRNRYPSLADFKGEADCLIDFSNHSCTRELLAYCVERRLPLVLATTGHDEGELELIQTAAETIPVFMSANMSIGVAVLAELAVKTAQAFPDADIEIIEKHHNRKLDVPSGTANMLVRSICSVRQGAVPVIGRSQYGKRRPEEIGVHSLRYGSEVGTHEIIISNGSETITLKHEAESRDLFAKGALAAAVFICGKPAGLYNMQNMLG